MQAEPGEAEVLPRRGRLHAALENEEVGAIGDRLRHAVRDEEDVDPILEQEATVEELELEAAVFALPDRPLGIEADRPVIVVAQLVVGRRQVGGRLLVRLLGEGAGERTDIARIEGLRPGRARGVLGLGIAAALARPEQASERHRHERQSGRPDQEFASLEHGASRFAAADPTAGGIVETQR